VSLKLVCVALLRVVRLLLRRCLTMLSVILLCYLEGTVVVVWVLLASLHREYPVISCSRELAGGVATKFYRQRK
jgi:hypothetical protein